MLLGAASAFQASALTEGRNLHIALCETCERCVCGERHTWGEAYPAASRCVVRREDVGQQRVGATRSTAAGATVASGYCILNGTRNGSGHTDNRTTTGHQQYNLQHGRQFFLPCSTPHFTQVQVPKWFILLMKPKNNESTPLNRMAPGSWVRSRR